ncbi:MAG TPA: folylpolyglutamate synthase/dihydrofolate synthase family protein [Candidatus Acidoferrales bacterium]
MTYDQSVRYLLTLGRELASPQQARAVKFNLENITAIAARLGHPERAVPAVHIAGTNGKGSTAAMLASILRAAGLRVGLYTSPHLVRINERIRLFDPLSPTTPEDIAARRADGDISDADFAATFTRVHSVIEDLLASGGLAAHPTYFECVTAMAFDFFASRKADIAVFEVGLGGRLDSTNILVPEVAVITQIDFDHENFLGHSIEEIAAEKAGIVKPGAWVVSAAGNPAAAQVIRARAALQNARLVDVDAAYRISGLHAADACYRFVVERAHAEPKSDIAISLALAGRFQVRNAVTAIAAAHLLAERGFGINDDAIVQGLAAVRWPGRLERVQERPAVYFDGTHNPAGARELAAFWLEHLAGRRIHLVYGAMRDKAVDEVAGLLFPRATTVILTQSPQPRAVSADALASMTRHLARVMEVIPDPVAALRRALELAAPDDVVFATGSLFVVGDLHHYWDAHHNLPPGSAPDRPDQADHALRHLKTV